ncbi:MAG TPA: 6-bladed beta-propeller [Gammaproteobacteria bacterium]|nr:6-bladed beta-propeller [Gammaproteobacteria bacterium]
MRPRRFLAWCPLLVLLGLAGCASAPMKMHLGGGGAPAAVWPAPPETPRYRYVGELTGEENFTLEGKNAGRRMLAWLVGLGRGRHEAVVLQRPQAGFTDAEGRVYVTDVSRAAVYVFDPVAGRLSVWEMADEDTRFETPLGIVVDARGRVLVADGDLGRVVILDGGGHPQGSFGTGVLVRPVGLARDPVTGRIFVADSQAHDIKVFDGEGHLLETWGRRGEGPGEFNAPTYLCFSGGRLYVTDTLNSRIQILDAQGRFLRSFGRRGLYVGDLPRPKGVAVDQDNNVYVVESYYDYLLVFNEKGEFLLPIGGTGSGIGRFYLPAGVWIDRHHRVYVADAFNGRVVIFEYLGGA